MEEITAEIFLMEKTNRKQNFVEIILRNQTQNKFLKKISIIKKYIDINDSNTDIILVSNEQ